MNNTISTIAQQDLYENKDLQLILPSGFFFNEDKLMHQEVDDDNQDPKTPIFVSSRLDIIALTRDPEGNNQGRLLEFNDLDGVRKQWAMPMALLARDGADYRAELFSQGFIIGSHRHAKSLLAQYILSTMPVERATCVESTGWHENCFLLPDKVYGQRQERLILQKESAVTNFYHVKGNLDDWRQHVSLPCRGNSRLVFSISLALAPPFLNLLDMESGGFHYFGPSSTGKTTASRVACSVWGGKDYMQRWRATVNGLEAIASLHNDTLLCLDEIAQCDPAKVGEVAYLLANGMGKSRANQLGRSKNRLKWRLLFLSNGELQLEQYMLEANKKTRAGQEVRLVEIPAQVGQYGIFEDLHGISSAKDFAELLERNCQKFHGSAGRGLLSHLVRDPEKFKRSVKDRINNFIKGNLPKGADGQVGRVLNRFALISAVGEIATSLGLTGWSDGEACAAASKCFQDWLQSRGGIDSQEEKTILSHLRLFFEKHGESRFSNWDASPLQKTLNRSGFRKVELGEVEFFVFSNVFRKEICAGFDHQFVSKIALKHGLIQPDTDGNPTRSERLPGHLKNIRCYRFTSKVLGEEDVIQDSCENSENDTSAEN